MTRPIPQEILETIILDPFYKKCCLCGVHQVQLHHNLINGGSQVNEVFCILPLCPSCHLQEKRKDIHEKLDWIMVSRATDAELQKYSKVINWIGRKQQLQNKYGTFTVK